jgi:hypothetical protein
VRGFPIGPRRRLRVRGLVEMGMAAHLCRLARPFWSLLFEPSRPIRAHIEV